jgi:hypothetical protein
MLLDSFCKKSLLDVFAMRALRADFYELTNFCIKKGSRWLPAHSLLVSEFLLGLDDKKNNRASTTRRKNSSISAIQRQSYFEGPT